VGDSASSDVPGTTQHGEIDTFVVRLDTNGDMLWQALFGGSGEDSANTIDEVGEVGFVIAGATTSSDIPGLVFHGWRDAYLVRIGQDGQIEWEQNYGGSDNDFASSVEHTSDGGFIISGWSESADFSEAGHEQSGAFLMKLDAQGKIDWHKVYPDEGDNMTRIASVRQIADGGFIAVGETWRGRFHTLWYVRLLKINATGDVLWERLYGGRPENK
jgi:hypothetical protein